MKYQEIPSSFFIRNRKKLVSQLTDNSLLILYSAEEYPRNGDQFYPFRQNSDFYYLSGIDQESTALLVWKGSQKNDVNILLFIKKTDKNQEIWFGKKLDPKTAKSKSGIDNVMFMDEMEDWIQKYSSVADNFYSWQPNMAKFDNNFLKGSLNFTLKERPEFLKMNQHNLYDITSVLRLVKDEEEIQAMKKAISITKDAYHRVLKSIQPSMYEYEIEAEISYEFLKQGATGHAYSPIIAGGINATILHYPDNDQKLNDGELLLMDFGAEYGNYAADCSRTIPINGKFTSRQKEYYNAVLDVYKKAIKLFVPGNTIDEINAKVNKWMELKLLELGLLTSEDIENSTTDTPAYFKYYMHGTCHFIGLDVHDTGTKQTPFEKGMILTCEPGLYIEKEKIGIRIETNVLVDDEPIDLMNDFPVEIEEIENYLAIR